MTTRPLTHAAVSLCAVAMLLSSASSASARAEPAAHPPSPDGVLVRWNRFLLELQAAPGIQPATIHPTYELAIMHAAIYDAVVSIDRSASPYRAAIHAPRSASTAAAADAAAHDTLVALYPQLQPEVDRRYGEELAGLPPGRRRFRGMLVGQDAAAQILAARAHDGATAPPFAFQPRSAPGEYQLTPPAFAQPAFTHWPLVRTFALPRADRFRPSPPPALISGEYAAAIDEVQRLGVAQGSARTPDQTQIGLFWNPAIWATWNRIAQAAAASHPGSLSRDARAFAALNLVMADSVIAFYDAKYAYRLWRPVTAIRAAGSDGNPGTVPDPAWTPLSPTAPDPSYPGAHGTISAAAARVLASVYRDRFAFTVSSAALPGVERSFGSFSEAAGEATASRIYNGNHTRIDQAAGAKLGRNVARFILRRFFTPRGGIQFGSA